MFTLCPGFIHLEPKSAMSTQCLLFCALLFFVSAAVFAQDSVSTDAKNASISESQQTDSAVVERLLNRAWDDYLYIDPDSAVILGKEALAFSRRTGFLLGELQSKRLIAIAQSVAGELYDSAALLEEAIEQARSAGEVEELSKLLGSYGIVLTEAGNYRGAIEVQMEAIKLDEAAGDAIAQAVGWNNVGLIYYDLAEPDEAERCFLRAIELYEQSDEPERSVNALSNMGMVLSNQRSFDQALDYYGRALSIAEASGLDRAEIMALANLGGVYFETGQFSEAASYLSRANEGASAYGDKVLYATVLLMRSKLDAGEGNYAGAIRRSLEALDMADSIGVMHIQQQASEYLSRYYRELGRDREALENYERSVALRDSITAEQNRREAMSQQFKYTFEKREALLIAEQEKKEALAAVELRRQQLQRNASIGGFALMLLLAVVFFSQRMRIAREKKRSEDLLLNILPAETAEELKATGSSAARHIDQVTVLFTDFKGFTQLSEQLTPQELVEMINGCFSAFDRITETCGIEKIKTIGDAYMAAGGVPSPNQTHANDVVCAAIAIQRFMADQKAERSAKGLPYFEIRIGIHTGPVVAGIVGIKKFQYDIWGDTVNTAARMESSGEVGRINISASTKALLGDRYRFHYRGEIEAKGKGLLGMYFVEEEDGTVPLQ